MNEFRRDLSLYALVAANLLPVVGVFFLGWDARDAVLLFWSENLIIGFYAVLRMALAPGELVQKVLMIPFFIFHFGMFTFVHGVFVVLLVSSPFAGGGWVGAGTGTVPAGGHGQPFANALDLAMTKIPWAVIALYLSHGLSFIRNYVLGEERHQTDIKQEMERPYRRVMVMHFTILAAFFLMIFGGVFGSAGDAARMVPPLTLIAVKLAVDARFHLKSHGFLSTPSFFWGQAV